MWYHMMENYKPIILIFIILRHIYKDPIYAQLGFEKYNRYLGTIMQEEIHELLLSFAEAGATVVRLKGGDPLVSFYFGNVGIKRNI